MSPAKNPTAATSGRQSAYVARKRAALLISGREILAEYGPAATIDEIANHAQVSPTTIYKYFDSREGFLNSAQSSLWHEWEEWAVNSSQEISEPLRRFINPLRLLIRVNETHPQLAQSLRHSTSSPDFLIQQLSGNSDIAVKALAKAGVVSSDDVEGRYLLFAHAVVAIIRKSLTGSSKKIENLEDLLVLALGLLGVSEGRARKALAYSIDY